MCERITLNSPFLFILSLLLLHCFIMYYDFTTFSHYMWKARILLTLSLSRTVLLTLSPDGIVLLAGVYYCVLIWVDEEILFLKPSFFFKFPDHYSRTKARAERFVLFNNEDREMGNQTRKEMERKTIGEEKLHRCALRLAGVYGPGERRHLPRILVRDIIIRGI